MLASGGSEVDLIAELKDIKGVAKKLSKPLSAADLGETIEAILDPIFKDIVIQADRADLRKFLLNATIKINERNLAERNLIRGLMLRLPSGQSVAKAMGLPPLTIENVPGFPPHLVNNTPLWYYILYEAKELKGGKRLGPVGSRIVAEVIIGLIQGDKTSFLNQDPNWVPKDINGDEKKDFNMADLLELAGVYH